ncbi:MAG TPA: SIMPL domain-containing protein [Solirubrobacteraceae bacterium]|nr:SIMPL domain-containing protein [Solirubrobacteraceae bacterium]
MATGVRDLSDAAEHTVTVRGDAVVRAEPDEALLRITLTRLADTPRAALADVSGRVGALQAMLDELGIAASDGSTSGVSVSEEFDHTAQGRRSLGHRATAQTTIRLVDHQLIGRLITQATEHLDARIAGPRWQIALDNPVRLVAARRAAANAEHKARAYAEGVGATLGEPLALSEPHEPHMIEPLALRAAAGHAEPLEIEPGEHEVSASVQVTFALQRDDAR